MMEAWDLGQRVVGLGWVNSLPSPTHWLSAGSRRSRDRA